MIKVTPRNIAFVPSVINKRVQPSEINQYAIDSAKRGTDYYAAK